MSNIIEKLGISPCPWYTGVNLLYDNVKDDKGKEVAYDIDRNEDKFLIAAAPEMLEALIKLHKTFERNVEWGNLKSANYAYMQITRPIIEKATGKTWKEIKDLINGK